MPIMPVLIVTDVDEAIDYYTDQLGFNEAFRQPGDDGKVVTGQVVRGDNRIMFATSSESSEVGSQNVFIWIRDEAMNLAEYYEKVRNLPDLTITKPLSSDSWGDDSFMMKDRFGFQLAFHKASTT